MVEFHVGIAFIAKMFDARKILSKIFDIYSKSVFMDAGNFFLHKAESVLRHLMWVSNYFINSFYSVLYLGAVQKKIGYQSIQSPVGYYCTKAHLGLNLPQLSFGTLTLLSDWRF